MSDTTYLTDSQGTSIRFGDVLISTNMRDDSGKLLQGLVTEDESRRAVVCVNGQKVDDDYHKTFSLYEFISPGAIISNNE